MRSFKDTLQTRKKKFFLVEIEKNKFFFEGRIFIINQLCSGGHVILANITSPHSIFLLII